MRSTCASAASEAEATVIREIFRRFAAGEGPRAIARALNERGVPGPRGRPWGDTTIRGQAKKGTGILNNELYRGRQVWGRLRFIKDPATGRRVSRLAPSETAIVTEVPHLRIVDEELWQAVKRRQREVIRPVTDPHATLPLNDLHRPRFLLSGLLTCGVCGGWVHDHRQGPLRLRAPRAPGHLLEQPRRPASRARAAGPGRTSHVPRDPDLVAEFTAEYQAEWNRLASQHRAASLQRERKLIEVRRRIDGILAALERGIITPTTKERLLELEAEQEALRRVPADPPTPAIHPNLARLYREKMRRIEEELTDPEIAAEAKSVLRSMIKTIVVFPGDGRGEVTLELHGELAAILAAAQGAKNKAGNPVSRIQVSVVAGARFDRNLKCMC